MAALPEYLNEEQEIIINEEYKIWKKNSPFLYDMIISHALEWPSLTMQWMPVPPVTHEEYALHHCLISSNATEKYQSYLVVATVKIPIEKEQERQTRNNKKVEKEYQNDPFFKSNTQKFEIVQKIPHQGEINRARCCPLAPNIVATKVVNGYVHLFNTAQPVTYTTAKPLAKLIGHSSEGYALAWNHKYKSHVLSGANDKMIYLWDIEASQSYNQRVYNIGSFDFHTTPVEDVSWHHQHKNIFASCSDDRLIAIWDTRFKLVEGRKPLFSIIAHTSEIYSLDFSPFNDYLLLSGSADCSVSLWDMRKLVHSVSSFKGHQDGILKVQWSPFNANIFASSGVDRKVIIWDVSRRDINNPTENSALFTHSGHRSRVPDFDWNPNEKLVVGSVEYSNMIQIWEMSKSLYYDSYEEMK